MNGGAVCDEGCVEGWEQVHLEPSLLSAGVCLGDVRGS